MINILLNIVTKFLKISVNRSKYFNNLASKKLFYYIEVLFKMFQVQFVPFEKGTKNTCWSGPQVTGLVEIAIM